MNITVFAVADYVLQRKDREFTLLQLIKICYLSYGWCLAIYKEKLFFERIEAWRYGPVIPELYYALKHFRGEILPPRCIESLVMNDNGVPKLPDKIKKLIDEVVSFYGDLSGVQLSTLTHQKGSPWHKTYRGIGRTWTRIPDQTIYAHFNKLKERNLND